MTLAPGTRFGSYEIAAAIGAGGMGEVYRARDTRLNRDVAIKVLPAAMASDPERLARFRREAQVLASLNHSNIAHVYGFEAATLPDGSSAHFLAMELVEGEDLSERLKRGAIPVDESIAIAKQIAEGLEDAHEHGIIHRDLKPANIKLTPDGKVKVLDFGLAKALEGDTAPSAADSQLSHSPTMSRHATEAGMIMGTAAYMSPEQARGKPVDKRADIWSFGVVLYEMLTGTRLFSGETLSDVLAAVLKTDPDWSALPEATPHGLRLLVRRCLNRNPKDRLHDIADARIALAEAMEGPPDPTTPRGTEPGGRTNRLWPGLTALALVAALGLGVVAGRLGQSSPPAVPLVRFALSADPDFQIGTSETTPFAISTDGGTIVFRAALRGSADSLWVRTLGDPVPRRLEGSEGGGRPAISPDGAWVVFVVSNQIKKAPARGGPVINLATISNTTGAIAWVSNDEIVFETIRPNLGIHHLSVNGGTPEVLIPLDSSGGERGQRVPLVLRESRTVLYLSSGTDRPTELVAFSLDGGKRTKLGLDGGRPLGLVAGHLVTARIDGALMATPYDARAVKLTGASIPLNKLVGRSDAGTKAALSENGTLVYQEPGTPAAQLRVLDADGRTQIETSEAKGFRSPRLSPDGQRVAVEVASGGLDPGTGRAVAMDLWVLDRRTLSATRLTTTSAASRPEWTPDGRGLIYVARTAPGRNEVWRLFLDGSVAPSRLVEIEDNVQHAVMEPDGRSVVVLTAGRAGGATEDLLRIPIDRPGTPSKILDLARLRGPSVSPDGRFVAFYEGYASDIHVRALNGTGALQVVDGDGTMPAWSGDSRHLYYLTRAGLAMAELQTSPALSVARRASLSGFPSRIAEFDVSRDGKTFVVTVPVNPGEVQVAVNWGDELRRVLGARQP